MIAVSEGAARALLTYPMTLKTRVHWAVGGTTAYGALANLDVTDRVVAGSVQCERALGPALGGYVASPLTLTLANHDGLLSLGRSDGYLTTGAVDALETAITIEQGPLKEDGTVEYVPVYAGVVDRVRQSLGQVELSVVSRLTSRMGRALAAEYSPIPYVSGPGNRTLASYLSGLGVTATVDAEVEAFLDSGWILDVTFPAGASIGEAAGQLCRSALATLIETEAGALRVIGEYLPKQAGWSADFAPRLLTAADLVGLERTAATSMGATEVVVSYLQGATAQYRDNTYETKIGRTTKRIELPFIATRTQAFWAAALIQLQNSAGSPGPYPEIVSFGLPGLGLILELNDRLFVRFKDDETPVALRVIGKSWTPSMVGIATIRESASIYGAASSTAFAEWGSTNWGSAVLA